MDQKAVCETKQLSDDDSWYELIRLKPQPLGDLILTLSALRSELIAWRAENSTTRGMTSSPSSRRLEGEVQL